MVVSCFDSQVVVARVALSRLFEPVDDQGESREAKTFNILALMAGCKNIDNNWRGKVLWIMRVGD